MPMARPPQYQNVTLAGFRSALALRLQDSGYVYWGADELDRYIRAALRTWQALTSSYSDRCQFSLVAGQAFYDLVTVASGQYGYTVTDLDLVEEIQGLLLEPVGVPWTGSNQFSLSQITQAIQKRRDQFLRDSGLVVTLLPDLYIPSASDGSVQIPDTVIAIRRAAWMNADGGYSPLYRTDPFGANNFSRSTTPGNPKSYSTGTSPPVSLNLFPPPNDTGGVQICAIQNGATLDPVTGVLLGVPDDFTQYVKFGALADLLAADGQCRDPQRAQYSESRYQEGVSVAQMYPGALQVQVGSQPIRVGSTQDFDTYNRGWQNSAGKPTRCGFTGRTLVAFNSVPDDVYSVTLDGARSMIVPAADGEYIQVGLEVMDAVLGYAQHLASFKMGGTEFQITQALYSEFVQVAARMNRKLKAEAFYLSALNQSAYTQALQIPMETK